MSNLCKCGKPVIAKGLCWVHYQRQRRGSSRDDVDLNSYTLTCLKKLQKQLGISPTVREVQECLGLKSSSAAHNRLQKLIDVGLISMREGSPRSIQIVEGTK